METSKPKWAREIEQHLGLNLVEARDSASWGKEYWVVSPTSVKMFKVGGSGEDKIGMVTTPDMYLIHPPSKATYSAG